MPHTHSIAADSALAKFFRLCTREGKLNLKRANQQLALLESANSSSNEQQRKLINLIKGLIAQHNNRRGWQELLKQAGSDIWNDYVQIGTERPIPLRAILPLFVVKKESKTEREKRDYRSHDHLLKKHQFPAYLHAPNKLAHNPIALFKECDAQAIQDYNHKRLQQARTVFSLLKENPELIFTAENNLSAYSHYLLTYYQQCLTRNETGIAFLDEEFEITTQAKIDKTRSQSIVFFKLIAAQADKAPLILCNPYLVGLQIKLGHEAVYQHPAPTDETSTDLLDSFLQHTTDEHGAVILEKAFLNFHLLLRCHTNIDVEEDTQKKKLINSLYTVIGFSLAAGRRINWKPEAFALPEPGFWFTEITINGSPICPASLLPNFTGHAARFYKEMLSVLTDNNQLMLDKHGISLYLEALLKNFEKLRLTEQLPFCIKLFGYINEQEGKERLVQQLLNRKTYPKLWRALQKIFSTTSTAQSVELKGIICTTRHGKKVFSPNYSENRSSGAAAGAGGAGAGSGAVPSRSRNLTELTKQVKIDWSKPKQIIQFIEKQFASYLTYNEDQIHELLAHVIKNLKFSFNGFYKALITSWGYDQHKHRVFIYMLFFAAVQVRIKASDDREKSSVRIIRQRAPRHWHKQLLEDNQCRQNDFLLYLDCELNNPETLKNPVAWRKARDYFFPRNNAQALVRLILVTMTLGTPGNAKKLIEETSEAQVSYVLAPKSDKVKRLLVDSFIPNSIIVLGLTCGALLSTEGANDALKNIKSELSNYTIYALICYLQSFNKVNALQRRTLLKGLVKIASCATIKDPELLKKIINLITKLTIISNKLLPTDIEALIKIINGANKQAISQNRKLVINTAYRYFEASYNFHERYELALILIRNYQPDLKQTTAEVEQCCSAALFLFHFANAVPEAITAKIKMLLSDANNGFNIPMLAKLFPGIESNKTATYINYDGHGSGKDIVQQPQSTQIIRAQHGIYLPVGSIDQLLSKAYLNGYLAIFNLRWPANLLFQHDFQASPYMLLLQQRLAGQKVVVNFTYFAEYTALRLESPDITKKERVTFLFARILKKERTTLTGKKIMPHSILSKTGGDQAFLNKCRVHFAQLLLFICAPEKQNTAISITIWLAKNLPPHINSKGKLNVSYADTVVSFLTVFLKLQQSYQTELNNDSDDEASKQTISQDDFFEQRAVLIAQQKTGWKMPNGEALVTATKAFTDTELTTRELFSLPSVGEEELPDFNNQADNSRRKKALTYADIQKVMLSQQTVHSTGDSAPASLKGSGSGAGAGATRSDLRDHDGSADFYERYVAATGGDDSDSQASNGEEESKVSSDRGSTDTAEESKVSSRQVEQASSSSAAYFARRRRGRNQQNAASGVEMPTLRHLRKHH